MAVERMDMLWAPIYDQHWGAQIDPTHSRMLRRFLANVPAGGVVLDAACGTGKYWRLIRDTGRGVYGVDHSQGMLDRATLKHLDVPVVRATLRDLAYAAWFDGVSCIDAMECVFPEDWPIVLRNFARAIKPPGGYVYLTVEISDVDLHAELARGRQAGHPLVLGEVLGVSEGGAAGVGSYHYYPNDQTVDRWLAAAGYAVIDDVTGDGYRHIVARVDRDELASLAASRMAASGLGALSSLSRTKESASSAGA
jgi:SAM-dependent methyltransferase